jgi:mRNA interferase RelE/StbE
MHRLIYTRRAQKALLKVPKNIGVRIRERLERIAADPYGRHANVARLQNRPGFRLRVGDWRVIYEVENEQLVILVLEIGSRGEVYR